QRIDQIVGHFLHLFLPDLCRADIHMAVYLHGIRGDDLRANGFCQAYGRGGLSHSGRACKYDQWSFHYTILLNFFSSSFFVIAIMVGLPWGQWYGLSRVSSSPIRASTS